MNVNDTFTHILNSGYNGERMDPRRGETFYLHLSDLRLALSRFRSDDPLKILD